VDHWHEDTTREASVAEAAGEATSFKRAWFAQQLPGAARGVCDSQLDPGWNHFRLPNHLARLGHENKARGVSRIVIEAREVRQTKCFAGVSDASGVAAPHIAIRNKMTAPVRPVPNTRDISFRAIHGDKHQVDLVPLGLGLAEEIDSTPAGQSCLNSETRALTEVLRRAVENMSCCGHWLRQMD